MEINMEYVWLLIGMVLILFELAVGTLVLLSLGASALLVAVIVLALPGMSLAVQLGAYALFTVLLTPLVIKKIAPRFHPSSTHYGTAGSSAHEGKSFVIVERDYDSAACIRIDNDLYRASFESGGIPQIGEQVSLVRFEGARGIVCPANLTS